MQILFIGDVHSDFKQLQDIVEKVSARKQIAAIFQVGDFGLSKKYLRLFKDLKLPAPLFFVDGNHEHFRFLHRSHKQRIKAQTDSMNIFFQPRGSTVEIAGIRAGFIGGALHVDQLQTRRHGNVITREDLGLALTSFNLQSPEIIISHSCPAGIGIGMLGNPGFAKDVFENIIMAGYSPGPENDYGEILLAELWENLKLKPKIWIYGHFHHFQITQIMGTQFISLPYLDARKHCVLWDTETGIIEALFEDEDQIIKRL
jgi:predicted phosphodiesterase